MRQKRCKLCGLFDTVTGDKLSDIGMSVARHKEHVQSFQHHEAMNPWMGTLKPQSNGPLQSNTAITTLAVTFGTARRGLGELRPRQVPSSLYQM